MASGTIIRWVDVSTYSQGDTLRIPTTFKIKLGIFTILLTRRHPDTVGWYYSVNGVTFEKLRHTDIVLAKKSVIEIIRRNWEIACNESHLVE